MIPKKLFNIFFQHIAFILFHQTKCENFQQFSIYNREMAHLEMKLKAGMWGKQLKGSYLDPFEFLCWHKHCFVWNYTKDFIKFTEGDHCANSLMSRGSFWNPSKFQSTVGSPSTFIAAAKNHFRPLVCPLHRCPLHCCPPPRSRCTDSYSGLCLQKGRYRPLQSCFLPLPRLLSPRPPDLCFCYCVVTSQWSPRAWREAEKSISRKLGTLLFLCDVKLTKAAVSEGAECGLCKEWSWSQPSLSLPPQ